MNGLAGGSRKCTADSKLSGVESCIVQGHLDPLDIVFLEADRIRFLVVRNNSLQHPWYQKSSSDIFWDILWYIVSFLGKISVSKRLVFVTTCIKWKLSLSSAILSKCNARIICLLWPSISSINIRTFMIKCIKFIFFAGYHGFVLNISMTTIGPMFTHITATRGQYWIDLW